MNSSGEPKARRRRPAVRTALPDAGVLVLLITSAVCPALGVAAEGPEPTGEIEFRDVLTLAYGSELNQIGYREEPETGGVYTVRAWCVSPRRTIWLVDEVSGLAKEFSLEGDVLRTVPALAQAWQKALGDDERLRERLVGPRNAQWLDAALPLRPYGMVPSELAMRSAYSMAEDAAGRLYIHGRALYRVILVLEREGQPIVERYDDEGNLADRSGWARIRNAIIRRARELGWERRPGFVAVRADTQGTIYVRVSGAPGALEAFSYFRLNEDLSPDKFLPAAWIGEGGTAFGWRYPTPVVEILSDGEHVDRAISLQLPDPIFGGPSSAWPIPEGRAWATADAEGRILVKVSEAVGPRKALIAFDGTSGEAIAWARMPEHERRSELPRPALDPEGGVFTLCFKNDGLHVLHLDL